MDWVGTLDAAALIIGCSFFNSRSSEILEQFAIPENHFHREHRTNGRVYSRSASANHVSVLTSRRKCLRPFLAGVRRAQATLFSKINYKLALRRNRPPDEGDLPDRAVVMRRVMSQQVVPLGCAHFDQQVAGLTHRLGPRCHVWLPP